MGEEKWPRGGIAWKAHDASMMVRAGVARWGEAEREKLLHMAAPDNVVYWSLEKR